MPSPKKLKKKIPVDEKQKSLFSFVENSETEKEEKSTKILKEELEEPKDQPKIQISPKAKGVKEEIKVKEEPFEIGY